VIFIIALILSPLLAQEVEIIHSDRLESFRSGNLIELIGAVHIYHAGRELRSNYARWEKRKGTVTFRGNVEIKDTSYAITANNIVYRRQNKTAEAKGDVTFIDNDSALFVDGQIGYYDGEDDFVRLAGEPHLTRVDSSSSRLDLDSRFLHHFMNERISIAIDSVYAVLTPSDSTGPKLYIRCDSLEFYQDSNLVIAYGGVHIEQESLTVSAPKALIWRDKNEILLVDGVTVTDPNWTMFADTLEVEMERDKINSALAAGNPRGLWHDPADSFNLVPDSRFSADTILFSFDNGRVDLVELVGQAEVDYSPAPTDTSVIDRHLISGDSIAVIFAESQMDSVEIHGGVQGVTYETKSQIIDSMMYKSELMALDAGKRVHLYENSWIQNKDMELYAGQIRFDGKSKLLYAESIESGNSTIGEPFMKDKTDSLRSDKLVFNIETKKGKLTYGRTAADKGFFTGEEMVKARGDTFYIARGTFTTCENKPPHYHFYTQKLKLIPKDKAVVRPVIMYVDKLPTFWLPFFVFSVKPKRHSGLLTMDVGKFQRGERFVRNLGYYWALSDYFDIYGALDINETSGIFIKGEFKYALRYYLSGACYSSYKLSSNRDWESGVSTTRRWELRGNHQQTLGEKAKFSGSLSMVSDADYLAETHEDSETRMDRSLRSYASFSQGFNWGSFSISADRTYDLDNNTKTTYLPKISLTKYKSTFLGEGENWYNNFYYSTSSNLVGYSQTDSLDTKEEHYGAKANGSVSFRHSFGDYVTLSPEVQLSGVVEDEGVDGAKLPVMGAYSFSTGASTDLYGNIPLDLFGFKFMQHIVSPSLSFSYSPEIEGSDNFYSFGGISALSSSEKMLMSFKLGQQFGLKKADTTGILKRIPLFSMNSSASYNFLSETQKFSDINTSLNANPARWLSMSLSFVHTMYRSGENHISGLYIKSAQMNNSLRWKFSIPFVELVNVSKSDSVKIATESREASISFTHFLSKNIETETLTHWVKTGINAYITPNWRVDYDIYYDIDHTIKVSDEFRIWRNMHCWELTFIWIPSGIRAGYYIRLNIKELPEIKIEKTEGNVRW